MRRLSIIHQWYYQCILVFGISLGFWAGLGVADGFAMVREYWIAAEKVRWDYAPSGQNLMDPAAGLSPWGDKSDYEKYRYIEYTDGSFSTPVPQPVWMGILGPQPRAIVGDTTLVHLTR